MLIDKWILDEHGEPLPCSDLHAWGKWFESNKGRIVAQIQIGEAKVSTVFLGLDHNHAGAEPILWETLIFGGPHNDFQHRCSGSRSDAIKMHRKAVAMCEPLLEEMYKVTDANSSTPKTLPE